MGPELIRSSMYDKMRDAQKEDVEKLLQEAPSGRPKAERLTRTEAAKQAAALAAGAPAADAGAQPAAATGSGASAVQEEDQEPDSYEFAEPKDIIPELKKDFWEGLEAAKWSERKAALTQLRELAKYPHLANGDYGDVNRELKKIITKDSHQQVWCISTTVAVEHFPHCCVRSQNNPAIHHHSVHDKMSFPCQHSI